MRRISLYTRKGDDGSTGLLGEGRFPKNDPHFDALGALDEASAALGVAKSLIKQVAVVELLTQSQRDLYSIMTEIAATPENRERFQTVDADDVLRVESVISQYECLVTPPSDFILPGDTRESGAIDMARAIVRRAERSVVELSRARLVDNQFLLSYLNRLSSLLFILELFLIQSDRKEPPTLAKTKDRTE